MHPHTLCSKNKLMKDIKFPKDLDAKVDPRKVDWTVMHGWIAKRVTELLGGLEEEVLIGTIYNYLEEKEKEPQVGRQCDGGRPPYGRGGSVVVAGLWSLSAHTHLTVKGQWHPPTHPPLPTHTLSLPPPAPLLTRRCPCPPPPLAAAAEWQGAAYEPDPLP